MKTWEAKNERLSCAHGRLGKDRAQKYAFLVDCAIFGHGMATGAKTHYRAITQRLRRASHATHEPTVWCKIKDLWLYFYMLSHKSEEARVAVPRGVEPLSSG